MIFMRLVSRRRVRYVPVAELVSFPDLHALCTKGLGTRLRLNISNGTQQLR